MVERRRDELSPGDYPSVELIYDFVLPSYDWAVRRLDTLDIPYPELAVHPHTRCSRGDHCHHRSRQQSGLSALVRYRCSSSILSVLLPAASALPASRVAPVCVNSGAGPSTAYPSGSVRSSKSLAHRMPTRESSRLPA